MTDAKKTTKKSNKGPESLERKVWHRDREAQQVSGELGVRIRNFREKEKLSLNKASSLTGVPAATLSRIETNNMSPTFPVLLKIMTGLKLSWADLMGPTPSMSQDDNISIYLPGDAPSHKIQGYTHWAPHADSPLAHLAQPLIFEVSAKTLETAGGLKGHEGIEFCYVINGTLTLHFEGRDPFDIPEGGSAMFAGKIPHSYVSKGRKKTKVLNIVMEDPVVSSGQSKEPFSARYDQDE